MMQVILKSLTTMILGYYDIGNTLILAETLKLCFICLIHSKFVIPVAVKVDK